MRIEHLPPLYVALISLLSLCLILVRVFAGKWISKLFDVKKQLSTSSMHAKIRRIFGVAVFYTVISALRQICIASHTFSVQKDIYDMYADLDTDSEPCSHFKDYLYSSLGYINTINSYIETLFDILVISGFILYTFPALRVSTVLFLLLTAGCQLLVDQGIERFKGERLLQLKQARNMFLKSADNTRSTQAILPGYSVRTDAKFDLIQTEYRPFSKHNIKNFAALYLPLILFFVYIGHGFVKVYTTKRPESLVLISYLFLDLYTSYKVFWETVNEQSEHRILYKDFEDNACEVVLRTVDSTPPSFPETLLQVTGLRLPFTSSVRSFTVARGEMVNVQLRVGNSYCLSVLQTTSSERVRRVGTHGTFEVFQLPLKQTVHDVLCAFIDTTQTQRMTSLMKALFPPHFDSGKEVWQISQSEQYKLKIVLFLCQTSFALLFWDNYLNALSLQEAQRVHQVVLHCILESKMGCVFTSHHASFEGIHKIIR